MDGNQDMMCDCTNTVLPSVGVDDIGITDVDRLLWFDVLSIIAAITRPHNVSNLTGTESFQYMGANPWA